MTGLFPSAKKTMFIGLSAALAIALSGCGTDSDSEPEPTVHFESPKMNDTLSGPNVFVKLATTHFRFSGAAANTDGSSDVVGHIHLFLDQPAGLDVDAVEQLSLSDTVTLENLAPGKHYLIAEGASATHDDIEGMEDSVAFTVVIH